MRKFWLSTTFALFLSAFSLIANEGILPQNIQKVMDQSKYAHSIWGLYVQDLETGKVLFDLNSDKLFSPASTTKLLSVAAFLQAFGDDYRFKTPVLAYGEIKNGILKGDLVLVAKGDLTLGGRQSHSDTLAFTKLDHIIANEVPGVTLTKEDPLQGLQALAKQVYESGIRVIEGNVWIDDSFFETTVKREMVISPIMINENLIDIVINPTEVNQRAHLSFRPKVPGYTVDNQMNTVDKEGSLKIKINADELGHSIVVTGMIPMGQHDVVRTFAIKDPKSFAVAAFIQALKEQGVKVHPTEEPQELLSDGVQVAVWTSPPLSEYGKLILKVSHNLGADLIPLLLASNKEQKTFDEGMRLLGDFAIRDVKLSPDSFVLVDAAGGNENRFTPQAEVKLLTFLHQQNPNRFRHFFDALPILGVDGSLEDFGKGTAAVGKVRAKTGTGAVFNLATNRFFLTTQALSGYIEGKNGHLFAYMLVVNNAKMPSMDDVFSIFEDEGQISNMIYNLTD